MPLVILSLRMDMTIVKWRKFKINTEEVFANLFENEQFTDVTLVCDDGTSVKAHRVVLAASSELFKTILEKTDNIQPLIYLHGIQPQVLKYGMEFIYKGKVEVLEKDLQDFLKFSKEFKLNGLLYDEGDAFLEKKMEVHVKEVVISKEEREVVEGNDHSDKENGDPNDANEEGIYMDMMQCKSLNVIEGRSIQKNKRKREVKIARYQNTLKNFEVYKKNFNKKVKQVDETLEIHPDDDFQCELCGFATNFEEIFKRHQLRHQLADLQSSGFNISKDNFTLPF